MLCAIAPGSIMFEETLNTLKYANRAKEIKVNVEVNKKVVELHIAEYKGIIDELRNEINDLSKRARQTEPSDPNVECLHCAIAPEVDRMINDLTEIFDEQTQLRKKVCDIKAQNLQNHLEMSNAKEESAANIAKVQDLASIEKSVDLNQTIKNETEVKINKLSKKAEFLIGQIQASLRSNDSLRVLEKIVQIKATQIENLELEINLNYYEKLNSMLMDEYKSLERQLNENMIDPGVNDNLVMVEPENIDMEKAIEEAEDFRKSIIESGIHFEEDDQVDDRLREDEMAESKYQGMQDSALGSQPSQVLSLDASLEEDDDNLQDGDTTPERLIRAKDVVTDENYQKQVERELDSRDVFGDNDQIHRSAHGLPRMGDRGDSGSRRQTYETAINRDTDMCNDSRVSNGGRFSVLGHAELPLAGGARPSTAQQVVSKKDMIDEINLLNTVDKSRLNFDKEISNITQDRPSTIRGDKRRERNQWNLTIVWGEEFRQYQGDFYPESAACFEGEIDVTDKDFEELLDESELKLLRNIELGEDL